MSSVSYLSLKFSGKRSCVSPSPSSLTQLPTFFHSPFASYHHILPSLFNLMPITFCFSFCSALACFSPCSLCSFSLPYFLPLPPPPEARTIHHSTRLSLPSTPEPPSSPHTDTHIHDFFSSFDFFLKSVSIEQALVFTYSSCASCFLSIPRHISCLCSRSYL